MSYILGIDSSSFEPSAAIVSDGVIISQQSSQDSFVGAESLLALVDDVCSAAGVHLYALRSIAVVVGPGSFTGIRSSIATAQGLAFGGGIPIQGISLFESAAAFIGRNSEFSKRVWLTLRANKIEFFCAMYEVSRLSGAVEIFPCTAIREDFLDETIEQALRGREDMPFVRHDLRDNSWRLSPRADVDEDSFISNAALVAQVAGSRSLTEGNESFQQLQPLYGKGVQAKTIVERMAVAGSNAKD